jgi:hypothetical protein
MASAQAAWMAALRAFDMIIAKIIPKAQATKIKGLFLDSAIQLRQNGRAL